MCNHENLNNHISVPLTILSIASDCNFAIIEMGNPIIKRNWIVLSICGPCLRTHYQYWQGASRRIRRRRRCCWKENRNCFNVDAKRWTGFSRTKQITKRGGQLCKCIYIWVLGKWIFVSGKIISGRTFATVSVEGVMMESNLVGIIITDNIFSCGFALGKYFSFITTEIAAGIAQYFPDNNRSELRTINGNHFILDAHNANLQYESGDRNLQNKRLYSRSPSSAIAGAGTWICTSGNTALFLNRARSAGFQLLVTK